MKKQSIEPMKTTRSSSAEKYPLATTPEGIVPALLSLFNATDVEVMLGFYEPDAVLVNAADVP
ncbi:hypothetical protein [Siphonobacter curvatus]|uniref:Uncharacterized protein n=1 Tax=Siphonobacter curvatus TaxID=2094562 RepID=A0A2S7IEU2_9BACT|nr:hypothetical protein [Siphonobacter curvatus]PQA53426.1 hypothetical protein C5O19_24590 [Siphonobacter curvatus]